MRPLFPRYLEMPNFYSTLIALILLVQIAVAATSTFSLTNYLRSVLSQPAFYQSRDAANLLQNVNNHTDSIEQISAASQKTHRNSTGVLEACQVGQLLLGQDSFLNASSTGYVNSTDDNWYSFLCVWGAEYRLC